MENTNTPIYRAEKSYSKEIIEGDLKVRGSTYSIYSRKQDGLSKATIIKKETLAIHFPDMIASDSNRLLPNGKKDLRIFASLQEDGKGGDILKTRGKKSPCKYQAGFIVETVTGICDLHMLLDNVKITGIKQ